MKKKLKVPEARPIIRTRKGSQWYEATEPGGEEFFATIYTLEDCSEAEFVLQMQSSFPKCEIKPEA